MRDVALSVSGRAVQLEGCSCGGAWVALNQLERLLGGEPVLETLSADTNRRCPACTLSLKPVLLPGVIPVETCSTCRGVWLDWADVGDLRIKELEAALLPEASKRYAGLSVADEPPPVAAVGFVCAKCATRTAFDQGHGTSLGLVCGACVPQIQPQPNLPKFLETHVGSDGALIDLTDVLSDD